jgi:uncharacterized protein (TIGR00730 family)
MKKFLPRVKDSLIQSYQFFGVLVQLMYGIWRVNRLPQPCVSIFGGTHVAPDNPLAHLAAHYAEQAGYIAGELAKAGISVLTGGGPGIMAAANCGALKFQKKKGGRTMGISVRGLEEEEGANVCTQGSLLIMNYFFARKWLLINYSVAFAVFPGGVGTLDELTELLTLMQTKQIEAAPVVLLGVEFWTPFIEWLRTTPAARHLIGKETLRWITVTDDSAKAASILRDHCLVCMLGENP